MARSTSRQESFGAFGWPESDGPDAGLGPDWSDRRSRGAISRPFTGVEVSSRVHHITDGDYRATEKSENGLWPAGTQERERIGYASPDAFQAAETGVDTSPLVAAAAEIASLEALAASPAMDRGQAEIADGARRDQVKAGLREARMLEHLLELPEAQGPQGDH